MVSPSTRWTKLNTDAAIVRRIQKTVITYVCRDSDGHILKNKGSIIGDISVIVVET